MTPTTATATATAPTAGSMMLPQMTVTGTQMGQQMGAAPPPTLIQQMMNGPKTTAGGVSYIPPIHTDQHIVEIDGKRKCILCEVEFTSAMCEIAHVRVRSIFKQKKQKYEMTPDTVWE